MGEINLQPAIQPAHCRHSRAILLTGILLVIFCTTVGGRVIAAGFWNGKQLMQEVHRRHQQFPYVYEEHSIILVDSAGQRDTRQARLYSRLEENGVFKILYIFQEPEEVKGVTLMATREPDDKTSTYMYLPAFGDHFIESSWTGSGGNFLGTDFSVEDLTAENLEDYDYERRDDKKIDDINYFVVDVFPTKGKPDSRFPLKRHFIRQDCFFITRTDYFDKQGRLKKQLNKYDLKQLDQEMWRANIVIMDDRRLNHQSIIKIDRRIFSTDYVPEEMFSEKWILANYPPLQQQETAAGNTDDSVQDGGSGGGETLSSAAQGQEQQ